MSRSHRIANLVVVIVPFLAFLVAIPLLWQRAIDLDDLLIMAVFYVMSALGITGGFHRLLTHRSFRTFKPVEYAFAILGSLAVEGPVITWVADHRKHHAHADEDGDPHSPHGHRGALRGLLHAHFGWFFSEEGRAEHGRYARDLVEDRGMRAISRAFPALVLVSLALPALLGWVVDGFRWQGALAGLLWGGFVRIFLLHHVTWSINSVCHFFGRRRFATDDQSTNVFWLALPSLGESWHHNHHTFPRSAAHGLRWWEVDVTALVIRTLKKVGLAWDVVAISPDRQRQKELRTN
jgi:stearoyl-CoA desaturase (delta-9 desaturase)